MEMISNDNDEYRIALFKSYMLRNVICEVMGRIIVLWPRIFLQLI